MKILWTIIWFASPYIAIFGHIISQDVAAEDGEEEERPSAVPNAARGGRAPAAAEQTGAYSFFFLVTIYFIYKKQGNSVLGAGIISLM